MAEIINLRQARKRKRREENERNAEENRALHSLPGKQRKTVRKNNRLNTDRLDGKKLAHINPDKNTPDKAEE